MPGAQVKGGAIRSYIVETECNVAAFETVYAADLGNEMIASLDLISRILASYETIAVLVRANP